MSDASPEPDELEFWDTAICVCMKWGFFYAIGVAVVLDEYGTAMTTVAQRQVFFASTSITIFSLLLTLVWMLRAAHARFSG